MKTAIIIASGLDDWEDADYWKLAAEQKHTTGLKIAKEKQDQGSLRALQRLHKELDQLNKYQSTGYYRTHGAGFDYR